MPALVGKMRTLKLIVKLTVFFGLIILVCFMVATCSASRRRIVTITKWTEQVSMLTFETRYWHYRLWSDVWADLSDLHKLRLMEEAVGWKGCFWVRGTGKAMPRSGREYRIGKEAWPIRWGDTPSPKALQSIVLDESDKMSWSTIDRNLSTGEVEEELAVAVYEESRRAATEFVKTNAIAIRVTSWEDYLKKTDAGTIRVSWGTFFADGSLVRLRATLLAAKTSDDGTVTADFAGHVLRINVEKAYREEVDAMGKDSETAGRPYDLWGYFSTRSAAEPRERAFFTAVLVVPAAMD